MKIVLRIFSLVFFASLSCPAQDKLLGTVSSVLDGNTIEVTTYEQETYKVLLHGIDSPEPGQPHHEQSTEYLKKLLLRKHVMIIMKGRDRHGNRLGEIHIDGAPDPRHEMVKAGMAWTSERQPDPELEALKEEARQKNIGLWKEENPTPPWTYRRQQTLAEAKSS